VTAGQGDGGSSRDVQRGALLPQNELGTDPAAIRAYAQGVEELGYRHLTCYEHVLGANIQSRPGWTGPYTSEHEFHEPFVLFAYLAAVTRELQFATCILVLPQRQTALVAKQAAELALLSRDRFWLGVAAGWNAVEFEGLGIPWERRAARLEEQISILRRLWTEPAFTFEGEFDTIPDAGIAPRPSRSVPIWIGGGFSRAVLSRIARLGDGWMPQTRAARELVEARETLRELLREQGRSLDELGIEVRLQLAQLPRERWAEEAANWIEAGVTHLTVTTHGLGCASVDDHLRVLGEVAELIGTP
jgi:probable F420-dependent oxidoreductase